MPRNPSLWPAQVKEGERVTMSEVLDRMINEGFNRGISIGEARGRSEGISIGEARGRSEGISIGEERTKKIYEEEIALLKAKLARYEAQELSN